MNTAFKFILPITAAGAALIASAAPAAGPGPDGATLFRQRCASCHNMSPGARAVLAPSLIGVVGRKAGSTQFNYSPALKASNLTWTRANLDQFLAAPGRKVPGTRMVISLTDAQQRAAVLNYLARPNP
ncbi:MAG: cytochrome c family protein [Novosphingobium sp.]